MDDLTGQVIRGYELQERIGAGGFGAVYRAFQTSVGREVAIKVILPAFANQPEFIRRFETEAQLVARLEHPFMVPLFDYWRDPDGAYIVMRLLRGGSLRSTLRDRQFTPDEALKAVEQIAGALAVAHRNNVIHRDLKPDNILLDEDGNFFLADFGIAKVANPVGENDEDESDEDEGLTGSPGYISPEQITSAPISPQTDIYSFGVIAYEMFSGHHPFEGLSVSELIMKHLSEPLPDFGFDNPDIPYEINMVIQKATSKEPEDRYGDVLEMAAAMRAAMQSMPVYDDILATSEIDLSAIVNPYKGLRPFEESDAADFFGRDALVQQILGRLKEDDPYARFLAVVGPSGSGKSSVVKAGVLPMLRWGEVPGSEAWYYEEIVPGDDPLRALADALTSVAYQKPVGLDLLLKSDNRGLVNAVNQVLPDEGELVLVIDQFEEAFTQLESEAERTHFLDMIRTAVSEPESRVRIIVTLRADFYDRPLYYEGFGTLMRLRTEVVLPLSASELERAITGPAERVGLEVEANLVAQIVSDVKEEPGALPLLQYVLTEVFTRRTGRTLTLEAYQESGGALGALARRADEIFAEMDEDERAATRQLFLRLVTLGEGTEDTRRRVHWAELKSFGGGSPVMQAVLDTFGKYRLLSFDRDPQTREPTVEVAHEALIREWKRLRQWLSESRDDVRMERNLAASTADWINSERDQSFLLRGNRLAQFEEWAQQTDLVLSSEEEDYLSASIAQRKQLEAEEAERIERERALEARARARLRVIVIGLALAFIGALALSALALSARQQAEVERDRAEIAAVTATVAQGRAEIEYDNAQTAVAEAVEARGIADEQRVIAEREAAIARSLALASNAANLLSGGNADLALALAVQANLMDAPPEQAQRVLGEIAYQPGMVRQIGGVHTDTITSVAFHPDGQRAVTASVDTTLTLWDLNTGEMIRTFKAHSLQVTSVAFTPDGTKMLSGSWDQSLILWDVETGEVLHQFGGFNSSIGHAGSVNALDIAPDGITAVSGSFDGLIIWNLETRELISRLSNTETGSISALHMMPDGQNILIGNQRGEMSLWDLNTGERIFDLRGHTSDVLAVDIHPDGLSAISSSRDGSMIVWDLTTGTAERRIGRTSGHELPVNSLKYIFDGTHLVTASEDASIILWNLQTGLPVQRFSGGAGQGGHIEPVNSIAVSPDERFILSGSDDTTLIMWSVTNRSIIRENSEYESFVTDVAITDDSTRMLTAYENGDVVIRDVATGATLMTFALEEGRSATAADISGDGALMLTGDDQGNLILWDTLSGAELARLSGHTDVVTAIAFSDDGTLAASTSDDETMILWDIENRTQIRIHTEGHSRRVLSVAFSPDGQTLITGAADRTAVLWDVGSGEVLHTLEGHDRRVVGVDIDASGSRAISASDDPSLILWDVESGRELRRFDVNVEGEEQTFTSIAFSADGRMAISGSEEGIVSLWDVESGHAIRQFSAVVRMTDADVPVAITDIRFSPQLPAAVAGAGDGTVYLLHVPSLEGLLEWTAENRFILALTCEQRAQYGVTPLCDEDGNLLNEP